MRLKKITYWLGITATSILLLNAVSPIIGLAATNNKNKNLSNKPLTVSYQRQIIRNYKKDVIQDINPTFTFKSKNTENYLIPMSKDYFLLNKNKKITVSGVQVTDKKSQKAYSRALSPYYKINSKDKSSLDLLKNDYYYFSLKAGQQFKIQLIGKTQATLNAIILNKDQEPINLQTLLKYQPGKTNWTAKQKQLVTQLKQKQSSNYLNGLNNLRINWSDLKQKNNVGKVSQKIGSALNKANATVPSNSENTVNNNAVNSSSSSNGSNTSAASNETGTKGSSSSSQSSSETSSTSSTNPISKMTNENSSSISNASDTAGNSSKQSASVAQNKTASSSNQLPKSIGSILEDSSQQNNSNSINKAVSQQKQAAKSVSLKATSLKAVKSSTAINSTNNLMESALSKTNTNTDKATKTTNKISAFALPDLTSLATADSGLVTSTFDTYFNGEYNEAPTADHPANLEYVFSIDPSQTNDSIDSNNDGSTDDTSTSDGILTDGNTVTYHYSLVANRLDGSTQTFTNLPNLSYNLSFVPTSNTFKNTTVSNSNSAFTFKNSSGESATGSMETGFTTTLPISPSQSGSGVSGSFSAQANNLPNGFKIQPQFSLEDDNVPANAAVFNMNSITSGVPDLTINQSFNLKIDSLSAKTGLFDTNNTNIYSRNVADTTKRSDRYVDYNYLLQNADGSTISPLSSLQLNLTRAQSGSYSLNGGSSQLIPEDGKTIEWYDGIPYNTNYNGFKDSTAEGNIDQAWTSYSPALNSNITLSMVDQNSYATDGNSNSSGVPSSTTRNLEITGASVTDIFGDKWNVDISSNPTSSVSWSENSTGTYDGFLQAGYTGSNVTNTTADDAMQDKNNYINQGTGNGSNEPISGIGFDTESSEEKVLSNVDFWQAFNNKTYSLASSNSNDVSIVLNGSYADEAGTYETSTPDGYFVFGVPKGGSTTTTQSASWLENATVDDFDWKYENDYVAAKDDSQVQAIRFVANPDKTFNLLGGNVMALNGLGSSDNTYGNDDDNGNIKLVVAHSNASVDGATAQDYLQSTSSHQYAGASKTDFQTNGLGTNIQSLSPSNYWTDWVNNFNAYRSWGYTWGVNSENSNNGNTYSANSENYFGYSQNLYFYGYKGTSIATLEKLLSGSSLTFGVKGDSTLDTSWNEEHDIFSLDSSMLDKIYYLNGNNQKAYLVPDSSSSNQFTIDSTHNSGLLEYMASEFSNNGYIHLELGTDDFTALQLGGSIPSFLTGNMKLSIPNLEYSANTGSSGTPSPWYMVSSPTGIGVQETSTPNTGGLNSSYKIDVTPYTSNTGGNTNLRGIIPLPQNGSSDGSSFNGSYTLTNVTVPQSNNQTVDLWYSTQANQDADLSSPISTGGSAGWVKWDGNTADLKNAKSIAYQVEGTSSNESFDIQLDLSTTGNAIGDLYRQRSQVNADGSYGTSAYSNYTAYMVQGTGQVTLHKQDSQNAAALPGTLFEIASSKNGDPFVQISSSEMIASAPSDVIVDPDNAKQAKAIYVAYSTQYNNDGVQPTDSVVKSWALSNNKYYIKTDSNGNATLSGLDPSIATYYVEEVQPTDGYADPVNPWTATPINQTTTITNDKVPDLTINKQDTSGNYLPGAYFKIYNDAGTQVTKDYYGNTIGDNGTVNTGTSTYAPINLVLPEGTYTIVEVQAPKGYELPKVSKTISVYFNDESYANFTDQIETPFPMTGGNIWQLIFFATLTVSLMITGLYFRNKHNKRLEK